MKQKSKMKTLLKTVALATPLSASAVIANAESSREYSASAVKVLENSATMLEHDAGWITTTSGPVGSAGIPDVIRSGDTITVEGKTVTANIIKVTEVLEDMKYRGEIFAHAGEVRCVVACSEANLPRDDERDRLWIFIKNCEPMAR